MRTDHLPFAMPDRAYSLDQGMEVLDIHALGS